MVDAALESGICCFKASLALADEETDPAADSLESPMRRVLNADQDMQCAVIIGHFWPFFDIAGPDLKLGISIKSASSPSHLMRHLSSTIFPR